MHDGNLYCVDASCVVPFVSIEMCANHLQDSRSKAKHNKEYMMALVNVSGNLDTIGSILSFFQIHSLRKVAKYSSSASTGKFSSHSVLFMIVNCNVHCCSCFWPI